MSPPHSIEQSTIEADEAVRFWNPNPDHSGTGLSTGQLVVANVDVREPSRASNLNCGDES